MKRRVALIGLLLSMMACGPALAEQAQGMLLVVTGAYYSPEGRVMVTGKPARGAAPGRPGRRVHSGGGGRAGLRPQRRRLHRRAC